MRKVVTGMWVTAAMLALGGVALATEPTTSETGTSSEVQQQSGMQSEQSIDMKSLKGEQAMKLQEKLKEQGLYDGQVDGKIGPLTKEALRKFQEQKGFSASGSLDSQTAAALGLDMSDIQPVSGQDEPTQPSTGTSVDPVASPTPMTNSGSTTTEPDSGVDKAGQSGQSGTSTTPQEGGEVENQAGSEDSAQSNEDMTDEGSGDARRFPAEGGDTGSDTTSDSATETQPQSGTDSTIDDQTLPENTTDIEGQSGTQSGDTGASDNATGTGSMNSGEDHTTSDTDSATVPDPQSGSDSTNTTEDTTSPVTGGGTETEETEATSGDAVGEGAMGGEGVSTDENSNVVNESDIEPQAGTSSTYDKKTIRKVEQALKAKKLFNGKVDGVLDDQTTQAIRAFQSQQGISVTGQLDANTLSSLGVKHNKVHQSGTDSTLPATPNEMATPNPETTPMPNETPGTPPIEPTNPTDPGTTSPQ